MNVRSVLEYGRPRKPPFGKRPIKQSNGKHHNVLSLSGAFSVSAREYGMKGLKEAKRRLLDEVFGRWESLEEWDNDERDTREIIRAINRALRRLEREGV